MVEQALMEAGSFVQAKRYILYRETRRRKRGERLKLMAYFPDFEPLAQILRDIEKDFAGDAYDIGILLRKFLSFYKEDKPLEERMGLLTQSAIELTDKEATGWEMIAGRLFNAFYLFQDDAAHGQPGPSPLLGQGGVPDPAESIRGGNPADLHQAGA